jgi:hypothetical protein
VLSLFRLIGMVLALPLLAATSTADLSPLDPGFASLHKFSVAEAKFGSTPVRNNSPLAKNFAELEDGPEGEDTPIANLVRAYDGDDQIETQFSFVTILFRVVALTPSFASVTPAQHYFPCAGFPTGPPTA